MKLLLAFLLAMPAFCAYTAKATVTFAAASGASTDTDITLYFTGNDARLKTTGNGGNVQHTVTRNSITVPADLILTNDTTCATQTGSYQWGFKTYSATAGTMVGRVKIPSLTTGAAVTPTVCVGNAAISTYQGGATGAEFDSNVVGCWDYPDGTTLSAVDCSASGNNGTLNNTPTAAAGHVGGGAASFVTGSSQSINIGGNPAALQLTATLTYECWFQLASLPGGSYVLVAKDDAVGTRGPILFINSGGLWFDIFVTSAPTTDNLHSTGVLSISTWYHAAFTFDGVNAIVYLNGGSPASIAFGGTETMNNPTATFSTGANTSGGGFANFMDGQIEDVHVASVARSADWILTDYTNQNSPPAIGAFTALGSTAVQTQIFIF